MGCSICLEGFLEDADDSRPACLPCGHVYHQVCVKEWLNQGTSRGPNKRGCPMCKKPASEADLVNLWPADLHDLDRILARREDAEARWAAEILGWSADEAGRLLDDLLDFRQAVQQYVQGLLGINVVHVGSSGKKMYKLIEDRVDEDAVKRELKMTMSSLQRALEQLRRQSNKLDARFEEVRQHAREIKTERARLKAQSEVIANRETTVQQQDHMLSTKAAEIVLMNEQVLHGQRALQDNIGKFEETRQKKAEEDRRVADDAMRMRIEAKQTVARKEEEVDRRLREMQERVDLAEAAQRDAEVERDQHRSKENTMAAQMRDMANKYKAAKAALYEERKKRQADRDLHEKKMAAAAAASQALRERLSHQSAVAGSVPDDSTTSAVASSRMSPLSPALQPSSSTSSSNRALTRAPRATGQFALSPSMDGRTSRRHSLTTSENGELPSNTLLDIEANASADLSSQSLLLVQDVRDLHGRDGRHRRREPADDDRDGRPSQGHLDFDAETDDDDDLPMPGLPAKRKFERTPSHTKSQVDGGSIDGLDISTSTKRPAHAAAKPFALFNRPVKKASEGGDKESLHSGRLSRAHTSLIGTTTGDPGPYNNNHDLIASVLNRDHGLVKGPRHRIRDRML